MAMTAAETNDTERCGQTWRDVDRLGRPLGGLPNLQSLVMDWLWKESEREGLRMMLGLPAGLTQRMMVLFTDQVHGKIQIGEGFSSVWGMISLRCL